MKYRQAILRSSVTPPRMCSVTIGEFDGGGNLVGEIELIGSPDNLLDLGQDISVAAYDLRQQIAQQDPPTGFMVGAKEKEESRSQEVYGFIYSPPHGFVYRPLFEAKEEAAKELLSIGVREYREILFKPYRIIYRVIENNVYVLLIADGRRDMQTLLQRRLLA